MPKNNISYITISTTFMKTQARALLFILVSGILFLSGYLIPANAQLYRWTGGVNNTWEQNGNWSTAGFPNSNNAIPYFFNTITTPTTITLGIPVQSRIVLFNDNFAYTISGAGSIQLDTAGAGGTVILGVLNSAGNAAHTVNVPISLNNDNLTILNQANQVFTINGTLNNNGNAINVQGAATGNIAISGIISGGGSLNKFSTNTLTLSGANTYSGLTTINAGIIDVQNASALGSSAAGTVVTNNATLELSLTGFNTIAGEALSITGTGTSGQGALHNDSGTNIWTGNVTLTGNAEITVDSGTILAFSNNTINLGANTLTVDANGASGLIGTSTITGTGNFVKNGSNTWHFIGGSNTYTGTTTVNSGTLRLGVAGGTSVPGNIVVNGGTVLWTSNEQIANSSNMTLNSGTLNLNGADETLGTLTLSSTSSVNFGSGSSILTFADSSATSWGGSAEMWLFNWSGSDTGGGTDQLIFSSAGLTATQLGQIYFVNPAGFAPGVYHSKFIGSEVVPAVPEPSTIIAGGLVLLILGWRERKRIKSILQSIIH
tara:strand:+ start:3865 stop:5502 length:1638 start_codon:yes stop_codon:yes gene_type:complete